MFSQFPRINRAETFLGIEFFRSFSFQSFIIFFWRFKHFTLFFSPSHMQQISCIALNLSKSVVPEFAKDQLIAEVWKCDPCLSGWPQDWSEDVEQVCRYSNKLLAKQNSKPKNSSKYFQPKYYAPEPRAKLHWYTANPDRLITPCRLNPGLLSEKLIIRGSAERLKSTVRGNVAHKMLKLISRSEAFEQWILLPWILKWAFEYKLSCACDHLLYSTFPHAGWSEEVK